MLLKQLGFTADGRHKFLLNKDGTKIHYPARTIDIDLKVMSESSIVEAHVFPANEWFCAAAGASRSEGLR